MKKVAFAVAVIAAVALANLLAMPPQGKPLSTLSQVQGPMQAFLRPAMWFYGVRNLRYHQEA
jgi:hypothetical protein